MPGIDHIPGFFCTFAPEFGLKAHIRVHWTVFRQA